MVDTETTTTGTELNQLITFELDPDETLYIAAGMSEMDNRTIFRGQSGGRYAVVPVDNLRPRKDVDSEFDFDLDLESLQILGEPVTLPKETNKRVVVHHDGEHIFSRGSPGVSGLLWIPSSVKN